MFNDYEQPTLSKLNRYSLKGSGQIRILIGNTCGRIVTSLPGDP